MVMLAEMGVPIKYGHSEVGYIQADEGDKRIWEQHEIELALQPLPQAADAVLIAQWVLRNLAHKAGWRCSFEPILRQGHAGNGLHFHMLTGRSTACTEAARGRACCEPFGKWLIGGLVSARRGADGLRQPRRRTRSCA